MISFESRRKNKVSTKKAGGSFPWPDNCPLCGQIWQGPTIFKPAEVFLSVNVPELQQSSGLSTHLPSLAHPRQTRPHSFKNSERSLVYLHVLTLYSRVHIKWFRSYEAPSRMLPGRKCDRVVVNLGGYRFSVAHAACSHEIHHSKPNYRSSFVFQTKYFPLLDVLLDLRSRLQYVL